MKKIILLLILLCFLVSCSNPEDQVKYVCSNGSVVLSIEECNLGNLSIEESTELNSEVFSEAINSNYNVDFEVLGIIANYDSDSRALNLVDTSFQIKNNDDVLDDLNLKIEIWLYDNYKKDGKIKIKESDFKLFEDTNLTSGTYYSRKYLNIQTFPDITGLNNPKVSINFFLYQVDTLLSNDTKNINILNKEGSISVVFPDKTKNINIDSSIREDYSILYSPFSFDYEKINKKLSKDAQFEFSITGIDDYYIEYTIENIGDKKINGNDLILDYYCQREIDSEEFSILIYDYYSLIEDLVVYKINQDFSVLPETLYPGEKATLYIPKVGCDKDILLLRKETSYYCRA